MNRTDRLLGIVDVLRRAGARGVSGRELAEHFEVSTRTIKRDVSALQQLGHAVWAQDGRGGGYRLEGSADLPPVNFTAGEALAVAIALGRSATGPYSPEGRTALGKLLDAMPAGERRRFEELATQVWTRDRPDPSARPRPSSTGGAPVRVVEQALADGRVVSMEYVDASGQVTRRVVEPMGLGIDDGVVYLFAWDRGRRAGRTFRADRIRAAWPTPEPAEHRWFADVFDRPVPDDVSTVQPPRPAR